MDWIDLNFDDLSSEVMLRLVKDVPIAGRVVNTEGRPVAGVSVSIASVWVPADEKLDDYLHGLLRTFKGPIHSTRKRLDVPLDAINGATMTDKDGRFTLRGAGGERIVHVAFSGGGIARSAPFVITRPGFDAKPYNAVLHKEYLSRIFAEWQRFLGLYPPEFTFVAEAGKTIEGVVKDADTGKPVAGCRVVTETSYDHIIAAESNAEGKYRLEDLAKRVHGFSVWVDPPKRSLYLYRGVNRVPDTVGFSTIRLDFALMKGAIITGRVVDKRTGKGVRCNIRSTPLAGNKFFDAKRPFDPRNQATSRVIEAGADGRFRLVALPGPSLLAATVRESVKFHGNYLWVYRKAVPDLDHKELFSEDGGSWRVQTAGGSFVYLESLNAVKVADVKENGETRVELSVDPGATARIVVQDADGKPLPGVWAAGLAEMRLNICQLQEATATVYSLNSAEPREMVFFHAAKKLGGTATVRGDEREPVIVKLAPLGKVSGRLLDREGKPLKGVEASIMGQSGFGRELYDVLYDSRTREPAYTDKDGRFTVEGVIPNLKFWVRLRNERIIDTEPDLDDKQIMPGQTLDFGDIRVKPAP